MPSFLARRDLLTFGLAGAATALAGVLTFAHAAEVLTFAVSAAALSLLAMLVGHATEELGTRLGPGATGVLQSALGNLPELFVGIFSLRAGLVTVVQSALIGSILANSLLVLGLAILFGGLKHGTQRFSSESPRMMATLMLLAVAALAIPTLASELHTPAAGHLNALDAAASIVLLVVFAASIPYSLSVEAAPAHAPHPTTPRVATDLGADFGGDMDDDVGEGPAPLVREPQPHGVHTVAPPSSGWPLWLAVTVLAAAGVGAAFVSDWFVGALKPAMGALHLSEAFAGFVIVAIAGNAVENVVGIQLALRNRSDYAMSVILNSSLQVALGLTPVLVLLSFFLGGAVLTLVLPPLLLAALLLTALVTAMVIYDGESIWLEGVALIGLYGIIAVSFWWG